MLDYGNKAFGLKIVMDGEVLDSRKFFLQEAKD